MRKKVLVMLLIAVTVMASVTGCGENKTKEAEKEYQEMGFSKEAAETFAALDAADREAAQEKEEFEQAAEEAADTYKKYPKDKAWDTAELNEEPIQIDDVFFKNGERLGDVMERFAASDVDYEYDYSPDKLMTADSKQTIDIKRNGFPWIDLEVHNFDEEESKSLQDLVITRYTVDEEAMPYIYILDGRSLDDFMQMNYSSIKSDPVLSRYSLEESNTTRDGVDAVSLTFSNSGSGDDEVKSVEWSGYRLQNTIFYIFYVDANTQDVIGLNLNNSMGCSWSEIPPATIQSLSEIPADELNPEWIDWGMPYVQDYYEQDVTGYVGAFLTEGNGVADMFSGELIPYNDMGLVYQLSDGTYGVMICKKMFYQNGEHIVCQDSDFAWNALESLDAVKEKYADVIDSTLP